MPPKSPSIRLLLAVGTAALSASLLAADPARGQASLQGDANPASPTATPERRGAPCGPLVLTHSVFQTVFPGNSVACINQTAGIFDNSYWRAFDLAAFGVPEGFAVCEVQIGIENADAGEVSGTQPMWINLFTSNPAFPGGFPGSLTPIGGANFNVPDQALTVAGFPVAGVAPAGSELVVEVFTPNGQASGNFFFIGSNPDGQTGPSYLSAADCGVLNPTPTEGVGFPNMHIVMNVVGERVIDIPPGEDCWQTECGRTKMGFCGLDDTAIPAGFFDPGSEPFEGEIRFGGAGKKTDTTVRRLQPMVLPGEGSQAEVQVELVELSLVSCEPITVIIDGQPVDWDVTAGLSEVPAGLGTLGVDRTHGNGGTFGAEFPVLPRLVFTRVDDPMQVRVLDLGLEGMPPIQFQTLAQAPWVSTLTGPNPPPICGINFAPGVEEDPDTLEQCCRKVGHAAPGQPHLHETGPPICMPCPRGACCDPADHSCEVVSLATCNSRPGHEYKGDGTTCHDSDMDGIADLLETNSCCSARDSCNTGTNPHNPDTDGDGWDDLTELNNGMDPCGSDVIFADGFESGDTSTWSTTVGG